MKKFFYRLFKFPVYKRWYIIKTAQEIRLLKVQIAINELATWEDWPLKYQREPISKILNYPKGSYITIEFLTSLIIYRDSPETLAKNLPLSWYIPK